MNHLTFTAGPEDAKKRIDKFIALKLGEGYSRTYVKFLIEEGFVFVGGEKVKPRYPVSAGEEITVELPPPEPIDVQPEDIPLSILYEDESIMVLNKPHGIVVHPAAGNKTGTLVNALLFHFNRALIRGLSSFLLISG